ncbi:hypothetical protein I5E68_10930 [Novosphingobium sp. YJ-S2-02]|uniref:Uncharacterized protein n=1 Tax=Novosphingobium aureum TaxID=2792964 RepID=A0A931HCV3_9SPHN|nr:hypothetical protein [Novosphingobium aureum]
MPTRNLLGKFEGADPQWVARDGIVAGMFIACLSTGPKFRVPPEGCGATMVQCGTFIVSTPARVLTNLWLVP